MTVEQIQEALASAVVAIASIEAESDGCRMITGPGGLPVGDVLGELHDLLPEMIGDLMLSCAFVGMHTPGGVPAGLSGRYDSELEAPASVLKKIAETLGSVGVTVHGH